MTMRVTFNAETKMYTFFRDVADKSCGESRTDWEVVAKCHGKELVAALERLALGGSTVEWV